MRAIILVERLRNRLKSLPKKPPVELPPGHSVGERYHYNMNKPNKLLIAALASMLLLAACGQKGALYLPETDQESSEQEQSQDDS